MTAGLGPTLPDENTTQDDGAQRRAQELSEKERTAKAAWDAAKQEADNFRANSTGEAPPFAVEPTVTGAPEGKGRRNTALEKVLFWTSPIWVPIACVYALSVYDGIEAERAEAEARQAAAAEDQRKAAEAALAQGDAEKRAAAQKQREQRAAEQAERDAACRVDWKCWAERHTLSATVRCEPLIEKMAKYDFEWTDGWLEPKMSRFGRTASDDVFRYIGDKIKLQNGFGAWQVHTYTCLYNVVTDQVQDVRLTPGRIK